MIEAQARRVIHTGLEIIRRVGIMTSIISRRSIITAAIATATVPSSFANAAPAQPGLGLITVAGLIENANRGGVDEKEDRFFVQSNIAFKSAFVLTDLSLAALPQIEVPVVKETGTLIYRGPSLTDILRKVVLKPGVQTVRLMALDGFAVDLTLNDANGQGWVLATSMGDRRFAVGDRGPAYSVRPLPGTAKRSEEEDQKWVHSVFYIEAMA